MNNTYNIAVLAGDAIGPEITREALRVLRLVEARSEADFDVHEVPFGASAYFSHGHAFPQETKAACDNADAILKGPAGLSHEDTQKIPVDERPERGAILPLRARYDTYANFRPVYLPGSIAGFSPLKPSVVGAGIDILIIRELVGGLYFGDKQRFVSDSGLRTVKESLDYDEAQIERVMRVAFDQARSRQKKLHNIHKSNVLASSVLWNEVAEEVHKDYPDVTLFHQLVDATATAMCLNPGAYDVMVMENMFGDILSDLGGGILGSLGLMPSACVGPEKSYYEPSHGSAPDIAGQNKANPYSMIGSVAMMLDMSFGMRTESDAVWQAMKSVLEGGQVTIDLAQSVEGADVVPTSRFGDLVCEKLEQLLA